MQTHPLTRGWPISNFATLEPKSRSALRSSPDAPEPVLSPPKDLAFETWDTRNPTAPPFAMHRNPGSTAHELCALGGNQ